MRKLVNCEVFCERVKGGTGADGAFFGAMRKVLPDRKEWCDNGEVFQAGYSGYGGG